MSRLRSFVTVTPGLEPVLAAELRNILGKGILSLVVTPGSSSSSSSLSKQQKINKTPATAERISLASLKKQQQKQLEPQQEDSSTSTSSSSTSSTTTSVKLPVLKIVEGGVEIPPLLIEDIWRVG